MSTLLSPKSKFCGPSQERKWTINVLWPRVAIAGSGIVVERENGNDEYFVSSKDGNSAGRAMIVTRTLIKNPDKPSRGLHRAIQARSQFSFKVLFWIFLVSR